MWRACLSWSAHPSTRVNVSSAHTVPSAGHILQDTMKWTDLIIGRSVDHEMYFFVCSPVRSECRCKQFTAILRFFFVEQSPDTNVKNYPLMCHTHAYDCMRWNRARLDFLRTQATPYSLYAIIPESRGLGTARRLYRRGAIDVFPIIVESFFKPSLKPWFNVTLQCQGSYPGSM